MIEFGHKGSAWDSIYPKREEIKEFPIDKKIKLREIRYKTRQNCTLSGIELIFTN